jgi:class 3 adenylate cyclase
VSYLPKLVVRRLFNSTATVKPPESESFQACVLFADISGFTPLTEKMAAKGPEGVEALSAALNNYFDTLIGTIYRFGGDIVKVENRFYYY